MHISITYIHTNIHTHIHTYVHTFIQTNIHTFIHSKMHISIQTSISIHIQSHHGHIQSCSFQNTQRSFDIFWKRYWFWTEPCIFTMAAYIVHIQIHTYIHLLIQICIYLIWYIHIYDIYDICIFVNTNKFSHSHTHSLILLFGTFMDKIQTWNQIHNVQKLGGSAKE